MAKKASKPAKPAKPAPKPAPRPPSDRGQGRKEFSPTADQQKIVTSASGIGLRHSLICQLIFNPTTGKPIDKKTLEKSFHAELAQGKAKTHFNVGKSLYDQAVGIPQLDDAGKQTGWISEPVTSAGIWYSKAQMGWKEGVKIEVSDLEAIVAGLGGNLAALRAARAAVVTEED